MRNSNLGTVRLQEGGKRERGHPGSLEVGGTGRERRREEILGVRETVKSGIGRGISHGIGPRMGPGTGLGIVPRIDPETGQVEEKDGDLEKMTITTRFHHK